MDSKYDSTKDTLEHIKKVSMYLNKAAIEIMERANRHDDSKLKNPEKELFDKLTPKLKNLTYNSKEYKESLKELEPALKHHYENNSHHPEHYENGIDGMDLFDILEMFFDWKAASERHNDGDFKKSIEINKERFNMDEQLYNIFLNTAKSQKLIK